MVDETHSIEEAIEHDIERLLHPTGTTGSAAPVPAVPGPTVASGPVPAAAPNFSTPATPTGTTGLQTPQGVTGPYHVKAAYEATGSSGPYFVLEKAPLTDAELAQGARFGFDSHGRPHVPPPEPTSSGGTGAQTGSQHQIFNKG